MVPKEAEGQAEVGWRWVKLTPTKPYREKLNVEIEMIRVVGTRAIFRAKHHGKPSQRLN